MIHVLDRGYVKLIETWGSDERIVESARMSTARGFEGWEKDARLLEHLYVNNHATPFEMCGLTIEVKAPIFVFREWHRHRTQSYNEMSARYVPLPDENYLPLPKGVCERAAAATKTKNKQAGSETKEPISPEQAKGDLVAVADYYRLGQRLYQQLLSNGWPREMARIVVPVGRYSAMRASANLRNWLGFLRLRTAPAAQWEIRQYAFAVAEVVRGEFPRTYQLYQDHG